MSAEKALVYLASGFGIIVLLVTPPFQSPDEYSHFYRAYGISRFEFVNEIRVRSEGEPIAFPAKSRYTGDVLPKSLREVHKALPLAFHADRRVTIEEIRQLFAIPLDPDDSQFTLIPHGGYPPVPYVPAAVGIFLGRVFDLPPILLMYLGRMATLVAWIGLVFWGIRIAPTFKWVLCLLALTPMSLFLGSTLSGDAITNALGFLLIATFLRFAFDDGLTIGGKELLLLFALSAMLSLAKQAYLVLVFLYFLIPVSKIGSPLKYFSILSALIFVGGLTTYLWSGWLMKGYSVVRDIADPNEQFDFIVSQPVTYAVTFFRTIYERFPQYGEGFVGRLGWMDTRLPKFLIVGYLLGLIGVSIVDNDQRVIITWKQKVGMLVLVIIPIIAMVFTYLYLVWTPPRADEIIGVQGRHFTPMSPVVFLLLCNRKITSRWDGLGRLIVLFCCITLTITVISLVTRYYGYL